MNYLQKWSLTLLFLSSISVQAQIVINELDISSQQVEIKNQGTSTVNITGYRLCNFPSYPTLSSSLVISGSLSIPAGGLVLINGTGLNLNAADDELGIYLPTGSFSDPLALVDYIEWGFSPHTRSATAVAAGTWTTGNFIPVPLAGNTINFDGQGNTALDYYHDSPTLGSPNILASDCHASNFSQTPNGLWSDQTAANGTRTALKWNHYSDASDGCIVEGALTDGVTNISPLVQVVMEGNLVAGDINGFDKSPNLGPSSPFTVFNANTYPNGNSNSMIPGAQYMWRVRCACIRNNSIPLPEILAPSNLYLSPWSSFTFFTNLGAGSIGAESSVNVKSTENQGLSIFPNPSSETVYLDLSRITQPILNISVRNALGEMVLNPSTENMKSGPIMFDVSTLESGMYFIQVVTSDGEHIQSLIKK
jgi:hypothetical protein